MVASTFHGFPQPQPERPLSQAPSGEKAATAATQLSPLEGSPATAETKFSSPATVTPTPHLWKALISLLFSAPRRPQALMRGYGLDGGGGWSLSSSFTTSCLCPGPPEEAGRGWMRLTSSLGQNLGWSPGAGDSILEGLKVCVSLGNRHLGAGMY